MPRSAEDVRSRGDLREFIHETLCERENLLKDQFSLCETRLLRAGKDCGLQFLLHGPRSIKLAAVWAADRNQVFFYDARGERFLKTTLVHHLGPDSVAA